MSRSPSVPIIVAATQAHRQFGNLIRRVFAGDEHFVIEKDGLPVAVILSVSEFSDLIQERERHERDKQARLNQFREATRILGHEIEKTGLSEEEMTTLLGDAKRQVYRKHYGSEQS